MNNKRLQEIKDGNCLLHGTEEWTNQEDADTEAVILELIAALEASQQQLAEANLNLADALKYRDINLSNFQKENKQTQDLRAQLAASQTELKRLEDLYNSDRANYLDDIALLQAEVGKLR